MRSKPICFMGAMLVALPMLLTTGCASLKPPPPLASLDQQCDKPPEYEGFWCCVGVIFQIVGEILASR